MGLEGRIPVLVGPTGVGKSEVAFHLAKRLGAEILSADAFQIYRGLPVGTAQPPAAWQGEVKHYLVGVRDPRLAWSAADFAEEALALIRPAEREKRKLLIVGGSGFYLKVLVEGIPPGSASSPEIREWVLAETRRMGKERAHEWLKERDPLAASRFPFTDTRRVGRALEKTFTPPHENPAPEPLGNQRVRFIGLERSRENLDLILRKRTEAIWEGGLLPETQALKEMSLPPGSPLWGAIGYAEAIAHLKGELSTTEAKERMFRRTRQYAKRQWTWFRRQHPVQWVNLDAFKNIPAMVDYLCELL